MKTLENNTLNIINSMIADGQSITLMSVIEKGSNYREAFNTIKNLINDKVVKDNGDGSFSMCMDEDSAKRYFAENGIWIADLDIATMTDAIDKLDEDAMAVLAALDERDNVVKGDLAGKCENLSGNVVSDLDSALKKLIDVNLVVEYGGRYFTKIDHDDFNMIQTTFLKIASVQAAQRMSAEDIEIAEQSFFRTVGVSKEDIDAARESAVAEKYKKESREANERIKERINRVLAMIHDNPADDEDDDEDEIDDFYFPDLDDEDEGEEDVNLCDDDDFDDEDDAMTVEELEEAFEDYKFKFDDEIEEALKENEDDDLDEAKIDRILEELTRKTSNIASNATEQNGANTSDRDAADNSSLENVCDKDTNEVEKNSGLSKILGQMEQAKKKKNGGSNE